MHKTLLPYTIHTFMVRYLDTGRYLPLCCAVHTAVYCGNKFLPPFLFGWSPGSVGLPASFQYIWEIKNGPQRFLVQWNVRLQLDVASQMHPIHNSKSKFCRPETVATRVSFEAWFYWKCWWLETWIGAGGEVLVQIFVYIIMF